MTDDELFPVVSQLVEHIRPCIYGISNQLYMLPVGMTRSEVHMAVITSAVSVLLAEKVSSEEQVGAKIATLLEVVRYIENILQQMLQGPNN